MKEIFGYVVEVIRVHGGVSSQGFRNKIKLDEHIKAMQMFNPNYKKEINVIEIKTERAWRKYFAMGEKKEST